MHIGSLEQPVFCQKRSICRQNEDAEAVDRTRLPLERVLAEHGAEGPRPLAHLSQKPGPTAFFITTGIAKWEKAKRF